MKIRHIFFWFLSITLPFVFLMNAVTLLFTPAFLEFEYKRSDFPKDKYGMTDEERLKYGSDSIDYITRNYDENFMKEMEFADGTPFYNDREISHMTDVKNVFQKSRLVLNVIMLIDLAGLWMTIRHTDAVSGLLKALFRGGYLTILLIAAVLAGIALDFDQFFTLFHKLFFNDNTWLFYETDSLIRLYPEPLWVSGFIFAGLLTLLFAILIMVISRYFSKQILRKRSES